LAQKNLQDVEQLPRKLQEQLAEIQPRSEPARGAEKQKADKEMAAALSAKTDRLEAVAEQIARGAADWAKADNAFHKLVATLEKFPSRPGKGPKAEAPAPKAEEPEPPAPAPAAPELIAEPSAPAPESAVLPPEPPAPPFVVTEAKAPEIPKWESEPEPLPTATVAEPVAEAAPAPALEFDLPIPVAALKAPRKPRKPKAEPAPEPVTPPASVPAEPEPDPAAAPAAAASAEFSQVSPEEAAPAPAVSSDGATRLLVTAYIGIGNRLFIRGDGPGLTWEKGVPLQFVSIGKWRWETAEASSPIKFKLYKNDEIESAGLGEGTLEAARQHELTAAF
jgi:hypothetical protein